MDIKAPAIGQTRSARHGGRYPAAGTMLNAAWERAWELMRAGEGYQEGMELSEAVTATVKVAPVTVLNLLGRAATAGLLERERRTVPGARGPRQRSFYRIKAS